MAKSEQFNASVNFGASVDPSLAATLSRITKGVVDTESAMQKAIKGQNEWLKSIETGGKSISEKIKNREQAITAMTKKRESLNKKMFDAKKEGKDISDMAVDYEKLARGIKAADKELKELHRDERARARWKSLATPSIEGLRKFGAGNIMDRMFAGVGKGVAASPGAVAGAVADGIKFGGVGVMALAAGALGANHALAEEARTAAGLGLTYTQYKAGAILGSQAGLSEESFGTIGDEFVKKLGDTGQAKQINQTLGLFSNMLQSNLQHLNRMDAMRAVFQTLSVAVKNKQVTKSQAESYADQLMGGDASKLMTYLLDANNGKGMTYDQAMAQTKGINNATDSDAAGAIAADRAISNVTTGLETAFMGIAGSLATDLGPELQTMEQQALAYIHENMGSFKGTIKNWVEGGGPERLVTDVEEFGDAVADVTKGLAHVLERLGIISGSGTPQDAESMDDAIQRAKEIERDKAKKDGVDIFSPEFERRVNHAGEEGGNAWLVARGVIPDPGYGGFNENDFGGPIPTLPAGDGGVTHNITHSPTINLTVNFAAGTPEDMAMQFKDIMQQHFDLAAPGYTYDQP